MSVSDMILLKNHHFYSTPSAFGVPFVGDLIRITKRSLTSEN